MKNYFERIFLCILVIILPITFLIGNSLSFAYNKNIYKSLINSNSSLLISDYDKSKLSSGIATGLIQNKSIQTVLENGRFAFSEKEIFHMRDVSLLIRKLTIIFSFLLLSSILLLIQFIRQKKNIRWLPIVSLFLLFLFGFVVLFTFEKSFTLFHLISFRNDFWILDPSKDLLIRLFPVSFFYLQFTKIVIMTFLELLFLSFLLRFTDK